MDFTRFLKRLAWQLLAWFVQTDFGQACVLLGVAVVMGWVLKDKIEGWWRGPESATETVKEDSPMVGHKRGLPSRGEVERTSRIAAAKGLVAIGRWSTRRLRERKKK